MPATADVTWQVYGKETEPCAGIVRLEPPGTGQAGPFLMASVTFTPVTADELGLVTVICPLTVKPLSMGALFVAVTVYEKVAVFSGVVMDAGAACFVNVQSKRREYVVCAVFVTWSVPGSGSSSVVAPAVAAVMATAASDMATSHARPPRELNGGCFIGTDLRAVRGKEMTPSEGRNWLDA
jgi:hypothetical protein